MFGGAIIYIIGLISGIRNGTTILRRNILAIITCVLCVVCACVCLGYGIDELKSDSSSYGSNTDYGSDANWESDGLSAYEYALLYLNISNVRIEQGYSYTYCTGTVTNLGSYSVRYIKVMGGFTNYRGSVIDTDWTYAVGSEWLSPGASTQFRLSVEKNSVITGCEVIFIE